MLSKLHFLFPYFRLVIANKLKTNKNSHNSKKTYCCDYFLHFKALFQRIKDKLTLEISEFWAKKGTRAVVKITITRV